MSEHPELPTMEETDMSVEVIAGHGEGCWGTPIPGSRKRTHSSPSVLEGASKYGILDLLVNAKSVEAEVNEWLAKRRNCSEKTAKWITNRLTKIVDLLNDAAGEMMTVRSTKMHRTTNLEEEIDEIRRDNARIMDKLDQMTWNIEGGMETGVRGIERIERRIGEQEGDIEEMKEMVRKEVQKNMQEEIGKVLKGKEKEKKEEKRVMVERIKEIENTQSLQNRILGEIKENMDRVYTGVSKVYRGEQEREVRMEERHREMMEKWGEERRGRAARETTVGNGMETEGGEESYAAAVRKRVKRKIERKSRKGVRITKEEQGKEIGGEKVRKELMGNIDPIKKGWEIVGFRRGRNAVFVDVMKKEQLKGIIEDTDLKEKGFRVEEQRKLFPWIILTGVPEDIGKEELGKRIEETIGRTKEELEGQLRVRVWRDARSGKRNVILEVNPETRRDLLRVGRIRVGWVSCRIEDFTTVLQCAKCFGFGHRAAVCRVCLSGVWQKWALFECVQRKRGG
ncbi:uncharacterized protein LOC112126415 [Cimex lectularius]|uniref:Uncharacterized protein n=1 Tax=Cimex lectularius TaxID=79782 RepID=A0A8I6SH97_CIMLE|nr:uncharacterized protein LOC112126415 [Cimex lectularius]